MEGKRKKRKCFLIGIIIGVLCLICICVYLQANKLLDTVKTYNVTVEKYNGLVKAYNDLIKKSCIDNIEDMPEEIGLLNVEEDDFFAAIEIMLSSNTKEKIEKDTQTIESLIDKVNSYYLIVSQITAPEEKWIIDRLKTIFIIKDIQTVSKDNNPDEMLGKEGAYTACVYFSLDGLDVSDVPGENVVEKGTDGGGAIEIYGSLEDAQARCEYLQGFDGTVLYSGSYAIVGTMVIRTSYLLSDIDQLYVTNEIVNSFTTLEEEANKQVEINVE